MTNNETIELRKNFLKQFDNYIINKIADETFIDWWLTLGLPDEYTEEDLDFIANDDNEWAYVCGVFGRICEKAEGW